MNYRNPKLLAAVRLLPCVNCGAMGTQAAHSNQLCHGSGTGIKASDAAIMALGVQCGCHFELDNGNKLSKEERRIMTYECIANTYIQLMERGLIKVL